MTSTRTYKTHCPYCGAEKETTSKSVAASGLACGTGPCLAAYNAQAEAYQAERKAAAAVRRQERASQPKPQPQMGEWGMAVLIGRQNGGAR